MVGSSGGVECKAEAEELLVGAQGEGAAAQSRVVETDGAEETGQIADGVGETFGSAADC